MDRNAGNSDRHNQRVENIYLNAGELPNRSTHNPRTAAVYRGVRWRTHGVKIYADRVVSPVRELTEAQQQPAHAIEAIEAIEAEQESLNRAPPVYWYSVDYVILNNIHEVLLTSATAFRSR